MRSPQALADDVERWMADEPVVGLARADVAAGAAVGEAEPDGRDRRRRWRSWPGWSGCRRCWRCRREANRAALDRTRPTGRR